jgi:hypothetical protein
MSIQRMRRNKKRTPIKYTSRDFDSIKTDLVQHVKRYYPDTFKDFNDASFGSIMLDAVSYVGDIMSFYLDYQSNESFLITALEYRNLIKLGKQLGYKFSGIPASVGLASFYIVVPANNLGLGPDVEYLPILKKGSTFSSTSGTAFILDEDVRFDHPQNEVVAAKINTDTGVPTSYAVKAFGKVSSGNLIVETIDIGSYERFRKVRLSNAGVTEVISVFDSSGHEYYEVNYLSQNVVYKDISNSKAESRDQVPAVLRPFVVARRFTVENLDGRTHLQFGYGSENELILPPVVDPADIALNIHGRNHSADDAFDPSKLLDTDKFGVAPANTTLAITYRVNNSRSTNVAVGGLRNVVSPEFSYNNPLEISRGIANGVNASLEVFNPDPIIGGTTVPSTPELKTRILDTFATQNRAVTTNDFHAMVYQMPAKFGALKRAAAIRDSDSFKRNLNLYVLAEDSNGKLIAPNSLLKENLKLWINRYKMIHDTIDILDAKIVNVGLKFSVVADSEINKFDVLAAAKKAIEDRFKEPLNIGEPLYLTDIYGVLNSVRGVIDTKKVELFLKTGSGYATTFFNFDDAMSADGRYLVCPKNVAFEIKYPSADIEGTVT